LVRSNIAKPSKNTQNPVVPLNFMSLKSAHKVLESLTMFESELEIFSPFAKGLRKNKANMIMKILRLFIVFNLLKISLPIFNIPHVQFLSICKKTQTGEDWSRSGCDHRELPDTCENIIVGYLAFGEKPDLPSPKPQTNVCLRNIIMSVVCK
jgi:hypothetical protein